MAVCCGSGKPKHDDEQFFLMLRLVLPNTSDPVLKYLVNSKTAPIIKDHLYGSPIFCRPLPEMPELFQVNDTSNVSDVCHCGPRWSGAASCPVHSGEPRWSSFSMTGNQDQAIHRLRPQVPYPVVTSGYNTVPQQDAVLSFSEMMSPNSASTNSSHTMNQSVGSQYQWSRYNYVPSQVAAPPFSELMSPSSAESSFSGVNPQYEWPYQSQVLYPVSPSGDNSTLAFQDAVPPFSETMSPTLTGSSCAVDQLGIDPQQTHSAGEQGISSSRRFSCDKCGKSYTAKHNLTYHGRTHNDTKPFACKYCGTAYRSSSDRRRHWTKAKGPCVSKYKASQAQGGAK